MEQVKKLIEAGLPIPAAIKHALKMPLTEFAEKYGLSHTAVVNHVNAIVRPSDETITALAAELGGTENEWRELLWQAMKPAHLAAS